jgi:hypothetical protein
MEEQQPPPPQPKNPYDFGDDDSNESDDGDIFSQFTGGSKKKQEPLGLKKKNKAPEE